MMRKKIILLFFMLIPFAMQSQQDTPAKKGNEKVSKLSLGLGMNIPFEPHSVNYGLGMSFNQQYEYLLWSHWSVVQTLNYNFISGKDVNEFYHGIYVDTQYGNFQTLPLQFGAGFYFGENHQTFFILLKGGIAWYWGVDPAYPEIVVNGNVVQEAVPRTTFKGSYNFFTPTIGWQFKRAQISASYQGSVENNSSINVLNLSFNYRIL
jgi:hypothetical protein